VVATTQKTISSTAFLATPKESLPLTSASPVYSHFLLSEKRALNLLLLLLGLLARWKGGTFVHSWG